MSLKNIAMKILCIDPPGSLYIFFGQTGIHRNSTGILPKFYYTGIQIEFLKIGRNIRLCYSYYCNTGIPEFLFVR